MDYNPTVKEFLAKKQGITVVGLFWAGYWRLWVFVVGLYLAAMFAIGVIIGITEVLY